MAFELPPLPYDYDALEPMISKETMTFHHDKHHAAYTAKLNEGVAADPKLEGKSIEEILGMISIAAAAGAQQWRRLLEPRFLLEDHDAKGGGAPSGKLADAIDAYGGLDKLKEDFNTKGAGQFGSGWAWVIADASASSRSPRRPTRTIR